MLSPHLLHVVGLNELEERLYLELLRDARTSLSGLARPLGISVGQVRRALDSLEADGLVSRVPGKAARFTPTPPGAALESLVLRRQAALEHVRALAQSLEVDFRSNLERRSPADVLEVLDSKEAVGARATQLFEDAQEQIFTFERPPYAVVPDRGFELGADAIRRGITARGVYDQDGVEHHSIERLQEYAGLGEEVRVVPRVPFKLNIIDRRLALIPLVMTDQPPEVGGALVVHASHLLDALILLFEMFWERAVPLAQLDGAKGVPLANKPIALDQIDERVLSLLVTGYKVDAIARHLSLGTSTIERRIKRMMDQVGAETRLQLGVQLARLGVV